MTLLFRRRHHDGGDARRLMHHAHVAMITGDSYRMRERKRAGIKFPGTKTEREVGRI
jgi:hypothetical protein